jgi:hypothetical protein
MIRTLIALLAALCFTAPLYAADDFGMTDTDFLQAINSTSIGLRIKVRIIGRTKDDPKFGTVITYGFGPCVVATAETDVKTKHIESFQVSPTADDHGGCTADDREMRNLVFIFTVTVLRVVTNVHDIKEVSAALVTLAERLKRDPNSGMRSAKMKFGGRTILMMLLLNDSRIEYIIYAD